ncbi:MAG: NADH dehydrogenase [Parcubacteria group bacterium Gr01-1014_30]|nr:MAG: NADH dehydrogenase [Parcubacteria group bacterium Gr01-1014_30]
MIIVGGGPAGVAAGVYAARKRIKTLLITESFGGQSTDSVDIQNWIGIVSMTGVELAERLEKHLKAYSDDVLELKPHVKVSRITQLKKAGEKGGPPSRGRSPLRRGEGPLFEVETDDGKKYQSRIIIFALGSRRRKLQVKGADTFEHKGVVYCASCDAPLFRDRDIVVVGGGNAGLEAAEQLTAYATSVHIFELGPEFHGDKMTQERVFKNPKVTAHTNAETLEIKGDTMVSQVVWKDKKTGETQELSVQGVFVEIGSIPNTEMLKGLVEMNKYGEVVIDHKRSRTSVEGIWASGDATDQPYKQNNISMGDAVKALEDAYLYLQKLK